MKWWLCAAYLIVASASIARANTVMVYSNVPPTSLGGGVFKYDYDIAISAQSALIAGDSFVIFDFAGYVPGSAVAPDATHWTTTVENVSSLGGALSLPASFSDNPFLPNLRFVYNENSPTVLGDVTQPYADTVIPNGQFSANSIYGNWHEGDYLSHDHRYSGDPAILGSAQHNFARTDVPLVPLPAAAWSGMAMLGLLGATRVRKAVR
jgi:hypothetical protein